MERTFWDVLDAGLRQQATRGTVTAPPARPGRPRVRGAGVYLTEKAERLLAAHDRRPEDR